MNIKSAVGRTLIVVIVAAIACTSFVLRSPARVVPVHLDPRLALPSDIKAFILRSCRDCHTDAPRLPWYASYPLVSWLILRDMRQGREAMDFSDWSVSNGASAGAVVGTLIAACADLQSNHMPPRRYTLLHASARPTLSDVQRWCNWVGEEVRGLRSGTEQIESSRGDQADREPLQGRSPRVRPF